MAQTSKKFTERRLYWYGHVMSRDMKNTHWGKVLRTEEEERLEKYWAEIGRGDGQGDVEKKDHQSYRRPYMMGKEEDCYRNVVHCHETLT